jgi:multidrug efflux pump subunit AcrA (membrane-fusion protein)
MNANNKKLVRIITLTAVIVTALVLVLSSVPDKKVHTVSSGLFELALEVKGEIQGKNAIIISLPDELTRRDMRIYQYKLKDMVEEGTVVKEGDWVATLDAAQITQQIQDNNQDMEKQRAELNDAKIDSSIQLTKLREELGEFVYDLEYKKLELEQARYESPAYQRKKKMEFDKTIREMEKKQRDYELKRLDLKMKTKRIEDRYIHHSKRDSLLKKAMIAARITAPKEGMVMYAKMWNGRKVRAGEDINIWMPTIAILPDMSQPVSEAYIQEIDITKMARGDSVEVTIDAIPGRKFKGAISNIANVGQELPGFDMKVFKIMIDLNLAGSEIKPAMTSNNKIVLKRMPNAIKIPRSCLFREHGQSYVYYMEGGKIWKKKVVPGPENDEEVVIEAGLVQNDKIYEGEPDNASEIAFLQM